jgi:predicted nuclease of predicted toxin-antitoxin system
VKLLFDANLSPGLVSRLSDLYPGSAHVLFVGLGAAPTDQAIWTYASANGFTEATKDADFYRLSTLFGVPPKVIWLRVGNIGTDAVEHVIRRSSVQIASLLTDPSAAILALGTP